jgi:hypothetical protein
MSCILSRTGGRSCLLSIALVVAAGCSSGPKEDRKPVFPTRGQLFVKDRPAAGAFVLFIPVNEPPEPKDPRPRAEVEKDGSFALSTYGDKDGAPAGDYVVTVTWKGGVLPDGQEEPEDKLFGRYATRTTSKLRATVKEGPNELPPFKIK